MCKSRMQDIEPQCNNHCSLLPFRHQEFQSADIDSSASRTNVETILLPSAPSYLRFLAGPGAAPHWKSGRAVTPDLTCGAAQAEENDTSPPNDYTMASRCFSVTQSRYNHNNCRDIENLEAKHDSDTILILAAFDSSGFKSSQQ